MSDAGKPDGAAAPVAAAPVAAAPAPAADAPAPAPAPAPAADAAPAAIVPPVEGAPALVEGAKPVEAAKPPEPEPSLLEQFDATGAKKPEGEKPKEGEKPAEGAKPVEAAAPVFEFKPYVLPEGIKAEEPQIKEFNEILTKADLDPQARGQELVTLHGKYMQQYADQLAAEQHRVFAETRKGWVNEIKSDPTIGGSGFNTTMMGVARMRDLFVPKEQMGAFNDFLKITGAGDHPAFIKLMNNVAKRFDEPSPPPPSFKPPPDIGVKPGRGGRAALYDHPNSQQRRNG
jgi:hypothetical protein